MLVSRAQPYVNKALRENVGGTNSGLEVAIGAAEYADPQNGLASSDIQ